MCQGLSLTNLFVALVQNLPYCVVSHRELLVKVENVLSTRVFKSLINSFHNRGYRLVQCGNLPLPWVAACLPLGQFSN